MATAVLTPRDRPWEMDTPRAMPSAKLWSPSPRMMSQARGLTAFSHLQGGVERRQEHVSWCRGGGERGEKQQWRGEEGRREGGVWREEGKVEREEVEGRSVDGGGVKRKEGKRRRGRGDV